MTAWEDEPREKRAKAAPGRTPVQGERDEQPARRRGRVWPGRVAVLAALLAAGGLLWVTRFGTRWPSVYYMTGPSMEPTVAAGEHFVAWSPPPAAPRRGDLVLFRFLDEGEEFHVLRRVVALPGDTVAMRRGAVVLNGAPQRWPFRIVEPLAWRSPLAIEPNLYDWGPWVVPRDSVVLLSDTRDIIGWPDSRFVGFVAVRDIVAAVGRE